MLNLKFALRTLFKTPFVTIVAIVSLALGIGANAAIFSLFNQLLLRPVAVPEAGRLVNLAAPGPKPGSNNCSQIGDCEEVFSYPMFRDLERAQTAFTGIAAHVTFGANLSARGQTQNGDGLLVSGSYFPVLGLKPAIGRLLGPEDDRAPGRTARRGPEPCLLADALRARSQRAQPAAHRQRPDDDDCRRRPAGLRQHDARGQAAGLRADLDARVFAALQTFRRPPQLLGVPLRAAETGRLDRAGARGNRARSIAAILNDVEAKLQKGMSEQTMARFKAKPILLTDGHPRARAQCRARRERRSRCCSASPRSCCSSRAPTSPTCCWRAAPPAPARWRFACRSAPVADSSCGSSSASRACSRSSAASAASCVAQWTLHLMAALLPAEATDTVTLEVDPAGDALRRRAARMGTGLLFGLFPALHSTRPDLVSALKGQSGPAVGRTVGGALPDVAGDGADRAVDGAARRRPDCSRGACSTSAASISG